MPMSTMRSLQVCWIIEEAVDRWAVFSEFTIYILRFSFGLCIGCDRFMS